MDSDVVPPLASGGTFVMENIRASILRGRQRRSAWGWGGVVYSATRFAVSLLGFFDKHNLCIYRISHDREKYDTEILAKLVGGFSISDYGSTRREILKKSHLCRWGNS